MEKGKERSLWYNEEEKAVFLKWAAMERLLEYANEYFSEDVACGKRKFWLYGHYIAMTYLYITLIVNILKNMGVIDVDI